MRVLTIGDVARVARVTPDAVRAWDREGKLRAFRTAGGIRLFREARVQKFLAERARRRGSRPNSGSMPQKAR
jgi:excisionase family DNA binding protein